MAQDVLIRTERYDRGTRLAAFRASTRVQTMALRWGVIVGAIAAWEISARTLYPDSLYVPAPSGIISNGLDIFTFADVRSALWLTVQEFLIAFGISASLGLLIALALVSTRLTRTLGRDVVQVLFTLPQVPLFPLLILFVGLGPTAKVVFGVSHGIFPVILATMAGASEVGDRLPNAIRAMGGSRWTVVWKAVLPSALPSVLTGLRVGAALSLGGVLLAELLASSGGIGYTTILLASTYKSEQLFALIFAICVGAILINWALSRVQVRLTRWKG